MPSSETLTHNRPQNGQSTSNELVEASHDFAPAEEGLASHGGLEVSPAVQTAHAPMNGHAATDLQMLPEEEPEEDAIDMGSAIQKEEAAGAGDDGEQHNEEPELQAKCKECEEEEKAEKEKEGTQIQPKLRVGAPGDKYEVEADQVADRVVQRLGKGDTIQRQANEEEKEGLQAKHNDDAAAPAVAEGGTEEEKGVIQEKSISIIQRAESKFPKIPDVKMEEPTEEGPKEEQKTETAKEGEQTEEKAKEESGEGGEAGQMDVPMPQPTEEEELKPPPEISKKEAGTADSSDATAKVEGPLRSSKGGGQPLSPNVKGNMESGFGADFSSVRVHTDQRAASMNQDLNARAFTNEQDIYFNSGEYEPDTKGGQQLLAHELTHTIQQGAVSDNVQAWSAPPKKADKEPMPSNPGDGGPVQSRMDSKIKNDPDFDDDAPKSASEMSEEDKEKANPDRGEVHSEKSQVESEGGNKVDVDRGGEAKSKAEDQKAQIEEQVSEEPETAEEGEGEGKEGENEDLSEAESAAQRSQDALSKAQAIKIPSQPEPFKQPTIEEPVDSAGKPLPRKPEVDTQVRGLGYMGDMLRKHGYDLKKKGAEEEQYGYGLEANLEKQREDLANAKEGTAKISDHTQARKEISEQSKGALKESQERQQFVAEKAPAIAGEADEGQSDSGTLATEANDKSAKAESNVPSDPDAQADGQKQAADAKAASDGARSMDEAVTATGERARQYIAEAEVAAGKNTESEGGISEADDIISQTEARVSEMEAKNEESNAKIEAAATGPEQIRQFGKHKAQTGDELIAATYVMEQELNSIQEEYLSGMKSIESKEKAEERIKKEQEQGGGGIPPEEQQVMELAGLSDEEQKEKVDEMDEGERKSIMATLEKMITTAPDKGTDETEGQRFEVKTGLNDMIMGEQASDPRMPEIQQVDNQRIQRLAGVLDIADRNISYLSEEEKAMLSEKLVGESIADDIKSIDILQMGKGMIQGMIDPRMSLTGVVDGFEKMLGGLANIGNLEAWKKDPLGNLLQIGADISTGLAMIFSSILGIAGIIMALMVAITIASWGFALPVTGPVMGWMGTVMTYAGWGAIIAGSLSVLFNSLAYIKNLNDAATASSARELFGNVEQMKQNASDGFTGAMAIVEGVGAAKMGPALKSGAAIKQMPKTPGQAFRQVGAGLADTGKAIKNLPGSIAKGAKRLFSGGKKGLVAFKNKIKGLFKRKPKVKGDIDVPGGPRKTTDVDAPSKPRADADAPGTTKTDTDAPGTTKTDADTPDAKKKKDADKPDSDLKTAKDQDLGTVGGKKVEAEVDFPDGHKGKALDDGQCAICSNCEQIRKKYGKELDADPELAADLKKIEKELDDLLESGNNPARQKELMAQQKKIHDDLLDRKVKRVKAEYDKAAPRGDFDEARVRKELEAGKEFDPETKRFSSDPDAKKNRWTDDNKKKLESDTPGKDSTPGTDSPDYEKVKSRKEKAKGDIEKLEADIDAKTKKAKEIDEKIAKGEEIDWDEVDADTKKYWEDKEASFDKRHPEAEHRKKFEESYDAEFGDMKDQPDYAKNREKAFQDQRKLAKQEHAESFGTANKNQQKGDIFEDARVEEGVIKRSPDQKIEVDVDGQKMNVSPDMEKPGPPHEFIEMKSGRVSLSADMEDQILRYAALVKSGKKVTFELLEGATDSVFDALKKYGIDYIDYSKII